MITIIHGDDIASSRNYYISMRQNTKNPVILDGEKLTVSDLIQSLEGGSLFNEEKEIFIENFFTSKKVNPGFKQIAEYINKQKLEYKLYFWENSQLSKAELAVFKNSTAKLFKIPQNLFLFLDNIKPNNLNSIKQFHDLLNSTAEELIFFMLVRQFRLLLAVSDFDKATIDEVKKLALWQTGKLKAQAKLFGIEKLKLIYNKLYEIDSAQKSGKLTTTLTQAIDFLLADL